MLNGEDTRAFLSWLKGEIPLLNQMGLLQLAFTENQLQLTAALAPNVNDKGTGFGGSLATLTTITGWSLVTLLLRAQELDCDVMIKDSQLKYQAPVTGDFTACAQLPDAADLAAFISSVQTRGKGRLALAVDLLQADTGQVCMQMHGNYVAVRRAD